jgi:hypothetical protein
MSDDFWEKERKEILDRHKARSASLSDSTETKPKPKEDPLWSKGNSHPASTTEE